MNVFKYLNEDLSTALRRDPAARNKVEVFLTYPGVHAVWNYRIAHWLWRNNLKLIVKEHPEIKFILIHFSLRYSTDTIISFFENENILIVETKDSEAIKKVGSDTSWCIVRSHSTFNSYTKDKVRRQFVVFDYTKGPFEVDFKIGFTVIEYIVIVFSLGLGSFVDKCSS